MRWKFLLGIGLIVGVLLTTDHAMAVGIVDTITQPYRDAGTKLAQNCLRYAESIFWILAAIQFVGSSIKLALGQGDIQEWATHIVRQILFVGIYAWIMQNFYHFSQLIVDSFKQVATASSISPSNVFQVGLKISSIMYANASVTHPISAIVYGLGALSISLCFGWVAALVIVALCESYILIAAGVLMTGFGGSEWTRDFSNKALMMAMSVGAKIFIMYTLIDIGWTVMNSWTALDYTKDTAVFEVLAGVFIYVMIVWQLPNLAQQFISGAATGSTAAEGLKAVTQAAATAALAATGVGMAGAAAYEAAGAAEGAGAMAEAGAAGAEGGVSGGAGGGGTSAGSNEAEAARMGGSEGSPAAQTGVSLGQIGRALGQGIKSEIYGRMTGTGIRGGTLGGRVAHYIARSRSTPPPPPNNNGSEEENHIS